MVLGVVGVLAVFESRFGPPAVFGEAFLADFSLPDKKIAGVVQPLFHFQFSEFTSSPQRRHIVMDEKPWRQTGSRKSRRRERFLPRFAVTHCKENACS